MYFSIIELFALCVKTQGPISLSEHQFIVEIRVGHLKLQIRGW